MSSCHVEPNLGVKVFVTSAQLTHPGSVRCRRHPQATVLVRRWARSVASVVVAVPQRTGALPNSFQGRRLRLDGSAWNLRPQSKDHSMLYPPTTSPPVDRLHALDVADRPLATTELDEPLTISARSRWRASPASGAERLRTPGSAVTASDPGTRAERHAPLPRRGCPRRGSPSRGRSIVASRFSRRSSMPSRRTRSRGEAVAFESLGTALDYAQRPGDRAAGPDPAHTVAWAT